MDRQLKLCSDKLEIRKPIAENGDDDTNNGDDDICSKIDRHLNETYVITGKTVPMADVEDKDSETALHSDSLQNKISSDVIVANSSIEERANGGSINNDVAEEGSRECEKDSAGKQSNGGDVYRVVLKESSKEQVKNVDKYLASGSSDQDSQKVTEDKNKDDCEDSRGADSDSGRKSFTIVPCSFASLSAENSKDGSSELTTKFAHQDVDTVEGGTSGSTGDNNPNDTDPFAQMPEGSSEEASLCQVQMDVDETETEGRGNTSHKLKEVPITPSQEPADDNEEMITGDKSMAPESILEDPNIDVCIIEDSMPSDAGGTEEGNVGGAAPLSGKRVSTEQVTSEHAYTLPPGASHQSTSDVEIVSELPVTTTPRKKTLKVIYPKKRVVDSQEVLVKSIQPVMKECLHCGKAVNCTMIIEVGGQECYLCSDMCLIKHRSLLKDTLTRANERPPEAGPTEGFVRKCAECSTAIVPSEKILSWETMEFCMEECLAKYQDKLGSHCAYCKNEVVSISLGKYCVRFGYDIKQFCQSSCLEEFKKGLKVCSYCQKDISDSSDGFLAAVGDGGQFKDFCSQTCMESYDRLTQNSPIQLFVHACDVCTKVRLVQVEVLLDSKPHKLCSDVCFAAFKFVNTIKVGHCDMCKKYYDKNTQEGEVTIFYEDGPHTFCSKSCMNIYILSKRKIVPCNWCKVKKYNFDMIKKVFSTGPMTVLMCSLNCLALYRVSIQAVSSKKIVCDKCGRLEQALYHLTMSDATFRNFCSYDCVVNFQAQFKNNRTQIVGSQPTPTGHPKRVLQKRGPTGMESLPGPSTQQMPVISSVGSLKPSSITNLGESQLPPIDKSLQGGSTTSTVPSQQPQNKVKLQILVKPPAPKKLKNKVTQVRPNCFNKATTCKPHRTAKVTQTDETHKDPIFIPIPIPIYVPVPMAMYSIPVPTPVPFPLPIPVPVFIPTTKNSAKEIMEDMKRIQEKIPNDPFEAELLMMAEMVAGDKKPSEAASSDSDHDISEPAESPGSCSGAEVMDAGSNSNAFGEVEMLQMALKMATELDAPSPVDLENALEPNNHIHHPADDPKAGRELNEDNRRDKKRSRDGGGGRISSKRVRRSSPTPNDPVVKQPKNDASSCLKYILGVNAYKQWVNIKNAEFEKSSAGSMKGKRFKTDVLQQTTEELNYSLSHFIEEARRPDGSEHSPDTIYYLCLGIQQYLYKNGRVDNIFTDAYYEKFTNCLSSIAKKFSSQFDNPTVITTRVREEHLWESRQLGVSSPHVLLTTLMYFNTKFFHLTSVEEHLQLSFSQIMKHWKKNSPSIQQAGSATNNGTKNSSPGSVTLRFCTPQSVLDSNPKKRKVYEQLENEENPYRCPVKLYEFYLSKCPESVKVRSDVFYLKPESSCAPDSPVWYSTAPLSHELLEKMLNLIRMVKEVNVALFTP